MQRSRITKAVAALALSGGLLIGASAPASALAGYAIGGKTVVATSSTTTHHALAGDPVIIHAPSMRSVEGCPQAVDEDGEIDEEAAPLGGTVTHADGTVYDCATGDYTIN